jgi:hypothetical protein
VTLLALSLGLALSAALPAESLPPPSPAAVMAVPSPFSASADSGWSAVADARGSTGFARDLDAWLALHPHGPLAARALVEKAALHDHLAEADGLLRRAIKEGRGGEDGAAAALELARLEYAQGWPAAALATLDAADAWPRAEECQAQWLYWRGQSRLALKLWRPAEEDFRQLEALWPHDSNAEAARLGGADCEAGLGEDEAAAGAYDSLAADGGPFAAQALWGLGTLRLSEGRLEEARGAYLRLRSSYPASFEAQAVPTELKSIAALARSPVPASTPAVGARRGRWSVQVGAYSKPRWADALARQLRRHRFRVKVQRKNFDGRVLYLVQVGPYTSRNRAAAAALVLQSREKLPFNLVAE